MSERRTPQVAEPTKPTETVESIDARAIAIDTLQTLDEFTRMLADQCRHTGELFKNPSPDAHTGMVQLADGLGTFYDSLTTSRAVLEIPMTGELVALDADFKSILQDLEIFHEEEKYSYVSELLADHLASNLERWRQIGIPELLKLVK